MMNNIASKNMLSGNYANPFAQPALMKKVQENAAQNVSAISSVIQQPAIQQKPQFADLIAKMDQQLIDFSEQSRNSETQLAKGENTAKDTKESFGFFDAIDVINPLQHIPVISNIYRAITGDEIRQEARIAGNVLFGALTGPVGIAMGLGSAAVDASTGKPVGDHMLAAVSPNLENTIRKEYSIAHYLHNPFSNSDDAAQIAMADTKANIAPVATSNPISATAVNVTPAVNSSQVYAQTAMAIQNKLQQADVTNNTAQIAATIPNPTDLDAAIVQQHTLANLIPNNNSALNNAFMANNANEVQSMAKSVAYSPSTVVQVSPDAAAQLASLAAGTSNINQLSAQMLGMTGDSAAQLQNVTSKNRQLGIALNSSAMISQQIDNAQTRQMDQQIGNKVAALYDHNSNATLTALSRAQQPLSEDNKTTSLTAIQADLQKPYFDENFENNQKQTALGLNTTSSKNNTAPQIQQAAVQPNQLGKHYHGANSTSNLSIAAAMQQALDKYQTLRRN